MGMKTSKEVRIWMKKGMLMDMRALMENLKGVPRTQMTLTFTGLEREVRSKMGTSVFMERYVNIWNRMSTLMEREKTTWMAGMTLHRSQMGTSIFMEG